MPDPSYPVQPPVRQRPPTARRYCCRATAAEQRFQLSAEAGGRTHWKRQRHARRAAGFALQPHRHLDRSRRQLRRIHGAGGSNAAGMTIVDEIYLGLSFDDPLYGQSALALDDQVISINSFSKYFSMTGWRLGLAGGAGGAGAGDRAASRRTSSSARARSRPACGPGLLRGRTAWPTYESRRPRSSRARRDYFVPALEQIGRIRGCRCCPMARSTSGQTAPPPAPGWVWP
jgi:hypothetical protein